MHRVTLDWYIDFKKISFGDTFKAFLKTMLKIFSQSTVSLILEHWCNIRNYS